MVIKTASPGIIVNEVDLTRGTSDAITTNIGALCGPFKRGPVDEITKIHTEDELERVFGRPTDENYEYWWTVSNFLDYGGVCYVVRCDDEIGDATVEEYNLDTGGQQAMRNAVDVFDASGKALYVKNKDHFTEDYENQSAHPAAFLSRNPGDWGNNIGIAIIDAGADYQFVLKAGNIRDGVKDQSEPDDTLFSGSVEGGDVIGEYIKVAASGDMNISLSGDDVTFPVYVEAYVDFAYTLINGKGYITAYNDGVYQILVTQGNFSEGDILTKGVASVGFVSANVSKVYPMGKHISYKPNNIDASLLAETGDNLFSDDEDELDSFDILAEYVIPGGTHNDRIVDSIWEPQTYSVIEGNNLFAWPIRPRNNQKARVLGPGQLGETYIYNSRSEEWVNGYEPAAGDCLYDGDNVFQVEFAGDWYRQQVAFQGLPWYRLASRPGTSPDAQDRGSKNDEMNIIVYDATGDLTGSKGNVLESYIGVSKFYNAKTPEGETNYYADRINEFSDILFALRPITGTNGYLNAGKAEVGFPLTADTYLEYIVPGTRTLKGGVDTLTSTLGELQYAYNKFDIEAVFDLDYILQGPAGNTLNDAVAKANFLISIVEERRDCMTFLSPPRYMVVNQDDAARMTVNVVNWANELSSSSYAVFDSGYKYQFDRFRDRYVYNPLNGDTAGTLVYSSFRAEPWFSPAGFQRGQIRNAVKLPFNPSRKQRDDLYSNRVNPVVDFPGEGTVLYGDKTALAYTSAFDRINVRRLFLICEKEIAKISKTTLFEFNDEVTRTLFKNNVNPFLRNVQSKRGMYDFLVVCDDSNNSPAIVDRNEFVADIYIKPSRSINFITLNFVATKTGMSFSEAVGLNRRTSF